MGKFTQRKKFDHPQLAAEQAAEFEHPQWKIPTVTVTATAREIDGQYWVYVTQEGDFISADDPLLPEYERVED